MASLAHVVRETSEMPRLLQVSDAAMPCMHAQPALHYQSMLTGMQVSDAAVPCMHPQVALHYQSMLGIDDCDKYFSMLETQASEVDNELFSQLAV